MSMWEDIIKCFKKGTKIAGCTETKISELFERVPRDQRRQLQVFAKKHDEYKTRVRKYPDKMPTIDWKYYRKNVRKEMVDWVRDYEKKYDTLDSMFTNRHTLIDYSKYFGEVMKQTEEVKTEVEKFKCESNQRIEVIEGRIKELKSLKPYTEMTMEEFCIARPEEAPDFINKPSFWPHTPEEQAVDEEHEHKHEETKDDKPDPTKPPPKVPPTGTAPEIKKDDSKQVKLKDPNEKVEDKGKVAAVKVEENETSQTTEKVLALASKGIDFIKDLGAKAMVLLKSLWEKAEKKRKEVANAAEAERSKKESSETTVKSISIERGSPEICNKTIIRGEETAKADVKDHHVDLTVEGDSEADICKEKKKEKSNKCEEYMREDTCKEEKKPNKCEEYMREDTCKEEKEPKKSKKDVANICFQKYQEEVKEKDECTKVIANPCDDACKENPQKDNKKCKPDEKAALLDTKSEANPQNPLTTSELNQVPPANVSAHNLGFESSSAPENKTIIGKHQEVLTAENEMFLGKEHLPEGSKDGKQLKEISEQLKGEVTMKSDQDNQQNVNEEFNEIAKVMFKMATGAAQLLSEAKKKIEQAQSENSGQVEALQHAFEKAEEKVDQALNQAYTALESAKKLTHRAQTTLEADEQKLVATIEKHIVLAKLLANRATTMQKEISKLLAGLKQMK